MGYAADQLTALTAKVVQDPHVQQILQAWQAERARTGVTGRGTQPGSYERQLNEAMAAAGLPKDTRVSFDAQGQPVVKNRGLPNWAYPLLFGAAVGTAGLATGAFAAPAAAAAAGGSALPSTLPLSSITGAAIAPTSTAIPAATTAATTFGTGETGSMIGAEGSGWAGTSAAEAAPSMLGRVAQAAVPAAMATKSLLGGSGGTGTAGDVSALPPDMQAILAEFARRVTAQGPLADATTAQALGGLPRTR